MVSKQIKTLNKNLDQLRARQEDSSHNFNKNLGPVGWIIITLCLLTIATFILIGYRDARNVNIDLNKSHDITNVVSALNNYYSHSSVVSNERHYPIAKCSKDLNSFDFEYTLRLELTGVEKLGNNEIINKDNFPRDARGSYSNNFPKNFQCIESLPVLDSTKSQYDDKYPVCKFDISNSRDCYLYSSTINGDSYKIAYYSHSKQRFIVLEKFRDEPIKNSTF